MPVEALLEDSSFDAAMLNGETMNRKGTHEDASRIRSTGRRSSAIVA